MAPHHRRRRALAGLVVALIAFLIAAEALSGSARHPGPALVPTRGYVTRIAKLAGSGPGSLAAQAQAAIVAGIDRTLAYTPYVRIAGSEHREIALTFDDGPGPYTPEILRILERDHVPATFFEVGLLEQWFHASTARMVHDGFVIGDHTQGHLAMSHLKPGQQRAQLLEQAAATGRYGAGFPRLFRPPYGLFDKATLALLHHYRMLMVLWTVDTGDYRRPGVKAIVHAAVAGARPGAIILLHDAGGNRTQTVAALPAIIRALRARGYALVTVPRLLLDNPPPRNQDLAAWAGGGG